MKNRLIYQLKEKEKEILKMLERKLLKIRIRKGNGMEDGTLKLQEGIQRNESIFKFKFIIKNFLIKILIFTTCRMFYIITFLNILLFSSSTWYTFFSISFRILRSRSINREVYWLSLRPFGIFWRSFLKMQI